MNETKPTYYYLALARDRSWMEAICFSATTIIVRFSFMKKNADCPTIVVTDTAHHHYHPHDSPDVFPTLTHSFFGSLSGFYGENWTRFHRDEWLRLIKSFVDHYKNEKNQ